MKAASVLVSTEGALVVVDLKQGLAKSSSVAPGLVACTVCKDVTFASVSGGKELHAWRVGARQAEVKCRVAEAATALALSNDCCWLVCGSAAGMLRVWEVWSGRLVREWEAHYKEVSVLKFTTDDAYVISASADGVVYPWSFTSVLDESAAPHALRAAWTWSEHLLAVTDLAVEGAGSLARVASVSRDSTLKVWELAGKHCACSVGLPEALSCVAFDAMESCVAVGGDSGTIYEVSLDAHGAAATAETAMIVSASSQQAAVLGVQPRTFAGHTARVTAVARVGDHWVSASLDGSLRIWDAATRLCERKIDLSRALSGDLKDSKIRGMTVLAATPIDKTPLAALGRYKDSACEEDAAPMRILRRAQLPETASKRAKHDCPAAHAAENAQGPDAAAGGVESVAGLQELLESTRTELARWQKVAQTLWQNREASS